MFEIARLRLNDVLELSRASSRNEAGLLRVRGRGEQERSVVLNNKACHALRKYLDVRPEVQEESLFLTAFKKPMTAHAVRKILKKASGGGGTRKHQASFDSTHPRGAACSSRHTTQDRSRKYGTSKFGQRRTSTGVWHSENDARSCKITPFRTASAILIALSSLGVGASNGMGISRQRG